MVEGKVNLLQVKQLTTSICFRDLCKTNLGNLYEIISGEVERFEIRSVAERSSREAPQIVVSKIEDGEVFKVLESVCLDLHGHTARPFRIVALDFEAFQSIKADKSSRGNNSDLAEVNGEVTEAWKTSEVIRAKYRFIKVDIRAFHAQAPSIVNLRNHSWSSLQSLEIAVELKTF